MASDIKLLPCPFCGGEARLINGIPKINYIKCKRCQTMTSSSEVIEHVIELWNTRKPIDRIVEQLEEKHTEMLGNTYLENFYVEGYCSAMGGGKV